MELKNTEDLREFLRNTIHERWTNVTAVSKKANVAQPSFQKFIKGTNGKAISTYTLFPILEVLGKKLVAVDTSPIITVDVNTLPDGRTMKDVLDEMSKQPMQLAPKTKVTKELLSSELKNRIEEYKSAPEPKEKFSVDLIIEFLEESYDKLAII